MKLVIIGAVAGGASAAARARRMDENAEIVIIERGPHISFANCGLPYFVGNEIKHREALLLQTPQSFNARYNVDVRVLSEAVKIDKAAKSVTVRDLNSGNTYEESYDKLILSPGASPFVPGIPGAHFDNVFTVRTVPDAERIKDFCEKTRPESAVVVGGGFIGLEMAENLAHRGMKVSIVEMQEQVMPAVDRDIAAYVHREIRAHGAELYLGRRLESIEKDSAGKLAANLDNGRTLSTDLVIMAVGVRPETALAESAGLLLGKRGGIEVNDYLQTSDENIYAVGDAIEVKHLITGEKALIPLAGPANRQGRYAAENAVLGNRRKFEGAYGTSIVRIFGLTLTGTGAGDKLLDRAGIKYLTSWTHSANHAGYYPGAQQMTIKLHFSPDDGKILGAFAVGGNGVDKRIDVLATAIRGGLTVYDLPEIDLAYAPPFGSAKDPVNMAGYVASNILEGTVEIIHWQEVHGHSNGRMIIDVRSPGECLAGIIPGAVNIPLDNLREHLDEIPRDREIVVYCRVGMRGYLAARILKQNGFKRIKNLSGGYLTYSSATEESPLSKEQRKALFTEKE